MGQRARETAVLASPTGASRLLAEERLTEPKCEALLPDSARAVKQETCGQGASRICFEEAFAYRIVAEERNEWHSQICRRRNWSGK